MRVPPMTTYSVILLCKSGRLPKCRPETMVSFPLLGAEGVHVAYAPCQWLQQFNNTSHQYEIRLERNSTVDLQPEDPETEAIPIVQYNVSSSLGFDNAMQHLLSYACTTASRQQALDSAKGQGCHRFRFAMFKAYESKAWAATHQGF